MCGINHEKFESAMSDEFLREHFETFKEEICHYFTGQMTIHH